MSLMTREDVLRELELLPVWQLKGQLPTIQNISVLNSVSEAVTEPTPLLSPQFEPVIEPVPLDNEAVEEVAVIVAPTKPFRLLISDDASLAFVLDSAIESNDTQDVETLLSNMLKAINMSCRVDMPNATLDTLNEHAVKLVMVMGESAANSLLGQLQTIDDWRNKQSVSPVYYQDLPAVITYHPEFLLKNTAYKAKAWVDLCTAKRMLQNL